MIKRDRRYELIKTMFNDGKIQTLNDIFEFVPKTIVATDLGKKVDRFTALINKVEKFTVEDLFRIGKLCDLEESQMFRLALKDYSIQKKNIEKQRENHKT
jgi:hypothetical protein